MATKYLKIFLTLLMINEMQIKTPMKMPFSLTRLSIIKKLIKMRSN